MMMIITIITINDVNNDINWFKRIINEQIIIIIIIIIITKLKSVV